MILPNVALLPPGHPLAFGPRGTVRIWVGMHLGHPVAGDAYLDPRCAVVWSLGRCLSPGPSLYLYNRAEVEVLVW